MWKLAGSALLKGGKWTLGLGAGALGLLGLDYATTGGSVTGGLVRGAGSKAGNALAEPAANTEVASKKFGFYEMVQWFGEILQLLGVKGGWPETIMKFAENGAAKTRDPNASLASAGVTPGGDPGAGAVAGTPGGSDPSGTDNNNGGWGHTAALAAGGVGLGTAGFYGTRAVRSMMAGKPAISAVAGGAAGKVDDSLSIMQAAQVGDKAERAAIGLVDDAAEGGAKGFFRNLLSKLPSGRLKAIGLGVAGVGVAGTALFAGAGPAEAATLSQGVAAAGGGATATLKNNEGSLSITKEDIVSNGLGIMGGTMAAKGVAAVAAPALASLGVKAVPGLASIWAAGETIVNVSGDLMRGDFKKAGLNAVSGVGETIAGLGGALTYLTVGTAWREAVRAGGAYAFGEENTIEHSTVVSLGSSLKDAFFGATNNTENAPAPQRLAPRANGPALAF
jgi:hypothetical protein